MKTVPFKAVSLCIKGSAEVGTVGVNVTEYDEVVFVIKVDI